MTQKCLAPGGPSHPLRQASDPRPGPSPRVRADLAPRLVPHQAPPPGRSPAPPSVLRAPPPVRPPGPAPRPLRGHLLPCRSPPRPTARLARRFTRLPAPRAARSSRTGAPRRSSSSASSRCLRCSCLPRPPAPAWPGASARCCRPKPGALEPAAALGAATVGDWDATPTATSRSAPGCEPRRPLQGRDSRVREGLPGLRPAP